MSAGAIFQEVLRIFTRQHFPEVSRRDLLATLEAGRLEPLAFLYDAGVEAGLPRQTLLTRAAAIYLNYCAANLADDLIDGDCTYLSEPIRIGPCVQFILQNLFFHVLAEAEMPHAVLAAATHDLVIGAGPQHLEVRTTQWTAPLYREVADGIAGRQWSAYLRILWSDTALADRAVAIGMNLGRAVLAWEDIHSHDPRYTTLSEADRHEIMDWTTAAVEDLRQEKLRCVDAALREIEPVLKEAL